ncbi:MAG TPA: immunoglobulin domain-containing protein [Candidatus Saccharimonadales bacterium]|nr:immunoglobulin domain-containing protein [Candidatus Saccharimonadales bacterium]
MDGLPTATTIAYGLIWISAASGLGFGAELAPVITRQPQPQTSFEGATLHVSVAAASEAGLRYRWRFNGTNLPNSFPGQFTPLLTLREATHEASGPYSVVVSNNYGAVTSATAQVTVNELFLTAGGYMNLTVQPGYSLYGSQLAGYGTNQTVKDQVLFVHDGSTLFKLDGNGFIANNFLDGWSLPDQIFTLGEGWYFNNPGPESYNISTLGNAPGIHLVNQLPAGHSVCASIIPQSGPLSSSLNFPTTFGAKVFLFDRVTETYSVYMVGEEGWSPSEPSVAVGQAFWVKEPYAKDWARDFNPFFGLSDMPSYYVVQPLLANETAEINFFTYNTDGISGRVLDLDGQTPLNHEFVAQLWAATNADENALRPIGEPAPFMDGLRAGYIRDGTIKLPGVRGGEVIYLQLRAWEESAGATYEQAVKQGSASGRSVIFSAVAHATIEDGEPGLPPRNANTFPTFMISAGQAVLQIARLRPANGVMEVSFCTQPGWVYCLQRASSLEEPMAWELVPGADEVIGTGHVATVFETMAARSFYRVCRVR